MNLKILTNTQRLTDLGIEKGKTYEIDEVVQDTYKIRVPKKQKGKFDYVLVNDEDGELVEDDDIVDDYDHDIY